MMEETKKQQERNSEVVKALFSLLFDVVWVSRMDPRHNNIYAEFRKTATALTSELVRSGLPVVDPSVREQIGLQIESLRGYLVQFSDNKVITPQQRTDADELLHRVLKQIEIPDCAG